MSKERKLKQAKQQEQDRCYVFYKVMMLYHHDYCVHVKEREKNCILNISTKIWIHTKKGWGLVSVKEKMFQQELILGVAGAAGVGAGGVAARRAGPSILITWLEYGTESVTDPPEVSQALCHFQLNKVYIILGHISTFLSAWKEFCIHLHHLFRVISVVGI